MGVNFQINATDLDEESTKCIYALIHLLSVKGKLRQLAYIALNVNSDFFWLPLYSVFVQYINCNYC